MAACFAVELCYHTQLNRKQAAFMNYNTGLASAQLSRLISLVVCTSKSGVEMTFPPILGLRNAVVVTVISLRRNRTQEDLAESHGVSQPTISRAITALTPVIAVALQDWVPVAKDLDPRQSYVLDDSLLPCWSWRTHPELYSGKHRTTGMNVQVACTLDGRLAWVSDPVDGRHHDAYALAASGLFDNTLDPALSVGDKGYIGTGLTTPIRKPPLREMSEHDKQFNTSINRLRWIIERTIANLKTWRILHTD